jgi:uncharacterized membrane protein YhiD involved in acid resistance
MMDMTYVNPVVDLTIAAILGGAVGIQRQAAQKPAGFRTHLLVALGSCAFTIVGMHAGDTRIAANVLTGIGFLGAGAIVREGVTAKGLTTAASIWTVAAIGVTVGFHTAFSLEVSLFTAAATLLALSLSDTWLARTFRFTRHATMTVSYDSSLVRDTMIMAALRECHLAAPLDTMVTEGAEGQHVQRTYRIELARDQDVGSLVREISGIAGVRTVSTNETYPG